jgi:hypothetical protein
MFGEYLNSESSLTIQLLMVKKYSSLSFELHPLSKIFGLGVVLVRSNLVLTAAEAIENEGFKYMS